MIVILTRDDVPLAHSYRPVESLKLYHMRLPVDTIQKADMIVFVEGETFKVLRHTHGINSLQSLDALIHYIKSVPQAQVEYPPMVQRHLPKPRRHHGNFRRRKGEKGELSAEESTRPNGQDANP
jgi:hypothetical protein